MIAILYRWTVKPGCDAQFIDGWTRVTRAIHERCGSFGSRLHRADDGTWVAYARWPDLETRDACEHGDEEGARLMRDAIEQRHPSVVMELVEDLLDER